MAHDLEKIRKLMNFTGAGLKKCIEALKISDNDYEKSLEWLKENLFYSRKSQFSNENINSDKKNPFGILVIKDNADEAFCFSLRCESSFAERTEIFINLSEKISKIFVDNLEEIKNSSEFKKTIEKNCEEEINNVSIYLKEKIDIEDINFFTKGNSEEFGIYVHNNKKAGSIVVIENCERKIADEIAFQVLVNEPIFISRVQIPKNKIDSKIEEIKNSLSDDLKMKKSFLVEKIVEGKFNKWCSKICLLEQDNFYDKRGTVSEIFPSKESVVKEMFYIDIS